MRRKELLKGLFQPDLSGEPPAASPPPSAPRVPSGAVRAMGMTLGRLEADGRELDALRARLEAGDAVVEVDPALVEPSFASDRLSRTGDAEFATLLDSIRASGQQVPILLRPHPDEAGRYQVAYGHRRLAAAAELGIPVRAVVRRMSDAQLVVAQGKENAERRNLSYIERALFAAELDARGFERSVIQSALSAQPAEMSRYLTVARAVPRDIAGAVGPAPRAGRPRWLELARLLEAAGARSAAQRVIEREGFAALGSDSRFEALIAALRPRASHGKTSDFLVRDGRDVPVLRVRRGAGAIQIELLPDAAPGLREHLVERLRDLVAEHGGGSDGSNGDRQHG